MTTNAKPRKLTALDVEVLRGAADGRLRRSESHQDLHASYLEFAGRETKVNRQVTKLTAGDEPLLRIGDDDRRWSRPWLLTAAGRAVLDANPTT
jgi:hypothetical protein